MRKGENSKHKKQQEEKPVFEDFQMPERFSVKYFFWNSPASFEAVAVTCCILGICIGAGISNALSNCWNYPQLWLYLSIYSFFHLAEFLVTAHYNRTRVSMASFLLANGWEYAVATAASVSEACITHFIAPHRHDLRKLTLAGLVLVVIGQYIRSRAMIHAAQSFNHRVQYRKNDDHELVTTGIYSRMRHPSYCGYYLWCVGTQLLLGNFFCTIAFSAILWLFFKSRIAREEIALIQFFGQEYISYRSMVWSGLPFV